MAYYTGNIATVPNSLPGIFTSISNTALGDASSDGWVVGVQQGLVTADVSNHSVVTCCSNRIQVKTRGIYPIDYIPFRRP